MKRLSIMIILLAGICLMMGLSASWNQYYFSFELTDKTALASISEIISIDNIRGNWVYAYANDDEFSEFQKLGLRTRLLPAPSSLVEIVPAQSKEAMRNWDTYPTYGAYVSMMQGYAATYPHLCQLVNAGTTVNGRSILFLKISDNISTAEAEPKVMLSSTMHGDEVVGFVLLLRLIDTLLSQYGSDPRITSIVNNTELWIGPNTNPDGTYYGGDNTLSQARRANANGYDLNRNFPSPSGNQYTGQPRQIETTHMMNLATANYFSLSANFHGGAEVVNYPWDYTYTTHADNSWYISSSLVYANSAQANGPAAYFTGISSSGITNGAAWYVVNGGRQDWMNYTARSREVTIEISNTKMPAASTLPSYWNYNYDAILSYVEQAHYGIHGMVTDPYGNPLAATISVLNHDDAYSPIFTDPQRGDFYRYLNPGSYSLQISAAGYPSRQIDAVQVGANTQTPLHVVMGELPHQQTISLSPGWNLLSFNIDLGANTIGDIFDNNLLQIKNTVHSHTPLMPEAFSNLAALEPKGGYWVHNLSSSTLSIQGELLSPTQHPIELVEGWNLVAYLPDEPLAVSSALSSIMPYLMELRSISSSWTPEGGDLHLMQPGGAYWIQVNQACQLIYPD